MLLSGHDTSPLEDYTRSYEEKDDIPSGEKGGKNYHDSV
jgi:hypothetical protein